MWYSIKKGNHTDGTPISITCGAKFYSRIGNHTVGTPRSIICGAKFCQYDILSRTGNHTRLSVGFPIEQDITLTESSITYHT